MVDDLERTLAERARAGRQDAFGELVARHRASALRVATVVLGASPGADDVVQDASVRAWRAIDTLDPDRGFGAWFLRITANCARNERRGRGRRGALAVRAGAQLSVVAEDPGERVVSDAQREIVVRAMNELGDDDRLVIALRWFEELSEAEMAEVMSCARGTVKSRLSRAMARLRVELTELGVEEAAGA